jgi:dihydroorotase
MSTILIKNALLVNEGSVRKASVLIENEFIKKIYETNESITESANESIDAEGFYLIPGCIDDQVHFREPGLTHKADIYTESRAAVAGGITSFMEMPNTVPNTLTQDLLQNKYDIAAEKSIANYSFYMGVSNDNLAEVVKTDPKKICGIKVFMGSSTGNMLVDSEKTLQGLFSEAPCIIASHCESETIIKNNVALFQKKFGNDVPFSEHPNIRSREACYQSSSKAIELATKYNARLHILHISTLEEVALFSNNLPLEQKKITAEACVHHLWFSQEDYAKKGAFIKWNPAVKTKSDRAAILAGLIDNKIDVIATDHAPHTLEEKMQGYWQAPSGGPLVQHALPALMEYVNQGILSIEFLVEKMCHAPAKLFQIEKRGFIRSGYFADLVLVNPNKKWEVSKENLLYKCKWSPFVGSTFSSQVEKTFVNGNMVYNSGNIIEGKLGKRIAFNR